MYGTECSWVLEHAKLGCNRSRGTNSTEIALQCTAQLCTRESLLTKLIIGKLGTALENVPLGISCRFIKIFIKILQPPESQDLNKKCCQCSEREIVRILFGLEYIFFYLNIDTKQ